MEIVKEAFPKLTKGDPLSDVEVQALIDYFSDLAIKVRLLGEQYHIFWLDIFHKKLKVEDYKRATQFTGHWSLLYDHTLLS